MSGEKGSSGTKVCLQSVGFLILEYHVFSIHGCMQIVYGAGLSHFETEDAVVNIVLKNNEKCFQCFIVQLVKP